METFGRLRDLHNDLIFQDVPPTERLTLFTSVFSLYLASTLNTTSGGALSTSWNIEAVAILQNLVNRRGRGINNGW